LETSKMHRILVLLWLGIVTLLVSTGYAVCLCQIQIITLNLEEVRCKLIRIVSKRFKHEGGDDTRSEGATPEPHEYFLTQIIILGSCSRK
jgi:hypothetical protein